jgi:outer membrane immunogenic protein
MGSTMKKLLLGTAMTVVLSGYAAAADLLVKAPPPPPPWSWTGFYVGLQGGAGWGTEERGFIEFCNPGGSCPIINAVPGTERSSFTLNGLHGGGTAGFNWQKGPIVFGVEGDISGSDINGTGDCSTSFGDAAGCHTKLDWFATLTGRLGFTVDHALIYIKGGGAWGHFNHDVVSTAAGCGAPGLSCSSSIGDNRSGFTVGTGIEYAIWHNWSAKVEYDYIDFGTKNLAFPLIVNTGKFAGTSFVDDRERVHVVRAGLNWRFDWGGWPIIARY